MELEISVEKPSKILRKLKIKIPAQTVSRRIEQGLVEVQRTAKIKGFRPGHVPLQVIEQHYGGDVRHRVYHSLIDESYKQAVREQNIRAVSSPKIESDHNAHGHDHDHAHEHTHEGHDHDDHSHHTLVEGHDLSYTATVEILPEIEVKTTTGMNFKRLKVEVTDKDVEQLLAGMQEGHAELIPATGGLLSADGSAQSRPAQLKDYVDIEFKGGIIADSGQIEEHAGMKGNRVVEIGSKSLIDGFEDQLIGMRSGETKTFEVPFPKDFPDEKLAGKNAQFSVTVKEVKEKRLPELNDDFSKTLGYENLEDLKTQARTHILKEKTDEADRKLRSDLLSFLIEKNSFDVPKALIEAQTRALAQEFAQNLKTQGFDEKLIQGAITQELSNLTKKAENQVRASLILEAIAKQEAVQVTEDEIKSEIKTMAVSMKVEEEKVIDFYQKNPSRKEDLVYRLREDKTVQFLLARSKIQ